MPQVGQAGVTLIDASLGGLKTSHLDGQSEDSRVTEFPQTWSQY